MAKLEDIEGIGPVYATKLRDAGVGSVEGLLKLGGTPGGRKDIATKAGISETNILEWVNRADLFRVKGIGEEYSDLLEAAGVDSVVELSKRRATTCIRRWSTRTRRRSSCAECRRRSRSRPGSSMRRPCRAPSATNRNRSIASR